MSGKWGRSRRPGQVFIIAVLLSVGLTLVNYIDYVGLLESVNETEFTINEMTHSIIGSKVEIAISFSLLNPTGYPRLKFSSLQCQLYLLTNGEEDFIGVTGYAPPVEIPLMPGESRTYTTKLSVSRENIESLIDGDLESDLEWRVRNVVHFSTPIRKYYQNINILQKSRFLEINP